MAFNKTAWHRLTAEEALERLESDARKGLTATEAARRLGQYGPNALERKQGQSGLLRFLLQFHQPLIYVLLGSALVTALLQEWIDAGVIFGVALVNAVIGFLQEDKALSAIHALSKFLDVPAEAVRDGQRVKLPASELVPGDIVAFQAGDSVPADLRLLTCSELRVDESSLTGESVPVDKRPQALDEDVGVADRANMAYAATLAVHGSGVGVTVATGASAEVGRIQELVRAADVLATPLTRKMARFSGRLLWIIMGLAVLAFAVGALRGESWFEMFMAAVALAVGAIPEGLPAAMTITLAIGVSRMAKRRAIVRKLPAVEALGSATVICTDKTGTLTRNQMTVREILAGNDRFQVEGGGYAPEGGFSRNGEAMDPARAPALWACLEAGLLCSDARLKRVDGAWRVEGDPTEGALVAAAAKAGMDPEAVRDERPRLDTAPFDSERKWMASLHEAPDGRRWIYLKGSAEAVLARCASAFEGDLDRDAMAAAVEEMAGRGLRVLALAHIEAAGDRTEIEPDALDAGFVFLGLQGMMDPPRPEAISAVKACRAAGVRVKMITGDHPATAAAIARMIGILNEDDGRVLDGRGLADLPASNAAGAIEKTSVFARVAPEQKLRIVEALQSRGHVVAMTGDGVNDAPALRQADIGVAMGSGGTEAAKEAADIVLTDDNFATIEAAVEEGRAVFDNLVKFLIWTLPTNIGEGLVILFAILAGVALPILPLQILWVNMTTAVLLGLMLAFERAEDGVMDRPPRDPRRPVIAGPWLYRLFLVGLLLLAGVFGVFEWALANGRSEAAARTAAVNMFVVSAIFYLFSCRSLTRSMFSLGVFSNRWALWGVAIMAALQAVFTYAPFMHRAFDAAPIGLAEWGWTIVGGAVVYAAVELDKWRCRRKRIPGG